MSQSSAGIRRFSWPHLSPGGALTVVAALVWLVVHNDYGMTWDEPSQCAYGEAVRNFIFGAHNFAVFDRADLPGNASNYGPLLPLVCALLARLTGRDIYLASHAVQGLLWVAMFHPVCALGRRLSGRPGAWCAGLALLGMPALLGQAFNNPKDLPLACAAIWMLHVSVAAASARRLNAWHAAKLGAATGFVVAMRPGAWFICALLFLVPLGAVWRAWRRRERRGWWRAFTGTLPVILAAGVMGWTLMVLPWPHAWYSPLRFPIHAARYAMHFDVVLPVLFGGTYIQGNRLPWDYLVVYLALTQPLPLLVLAIGGQPIFFRKLFGSVSKGVAVAGTLFLFWFPLMMFVLLRPNVYDGMRHFLFILPAFALFAGTAAASLIRHQRRLSRLLAAPAVAIILLAAVPDMVRLHPYQNAFYNCLAGPRSALTSRYETDYWLSSYREAAEWLNQVAPAHQRLSVMLAAAFATGDTSALPTFAHFLDPQIQVTPLAFGHYRAAQLPTNVDYYVATSRFMQNQNFSSYPIVHMVERDGIVLAVIRENRPETAR